ncbi:MAG TPA: RNA degradosome polyphosphate kinase, partial [Actinomycetota bacterium]|nr:RNA degradosome polyphosphate kinase [Actinomycetota bacterium]
MMTNEATAATPAAPIPDRQWNASASVLLEPELSAVAYRERLLSRAENRALPLLERAKFIEVFERSFEEFFQVAVGRLDVRVERDPRDLRARRLAAEVTAATHRLHRRAEAAGASVLRDLERAGVVVCGWADLEAGERRFCREAFAALMLPAIAPHLRVATRRHLPFVRGGMHHLVVGLADRLTGAPSLAILPLPGGLPRLVAMARPGRFAVLDAIVGANLPRAFPDMDVTGHWSFRVTRPADADPENAAERTDLVAAVRSAVDRRRRTDRAVRLEIDAEAPDDVRSVIAGALGIGADRVYPTGHLGAGLAGSLHALERPDLRGPPARPVTAPRLRPAGEGRGDVFAALDRGDVLVHHPYEAFDTSVEAFLQQAAADPEVVAIKQTLYRMSAPASPVAESLIRAAEAGKDVLALVEIRARFDEEANIGWASTLEHAGVHVVHGVLGLKTHAKIALVVRRERGGLRRYGHISTGNYNGDTAHEYEDVGVLTAD